MKKKEWQNGKKKKKKKFDFPRSVRPENIAYTSLGGDGGKKEEWHCMKINERE